jgi:chorismate synthase
MVLLIPWLNNSAVMQQLARQNAASLLQPVADTPLRPGPFLMPVPGGQAIKVEEASKPKTE